MGWSIERILGHAVRGISSSISSATTSICRSFSTTGVIHHRNQVPFDSVETAVQQVDDSFGALIDKLTTIDEGQWLEVGQFYAGDHLVMEAPCQQLAWMMLLDAVHHRGQLSTYLRPMGSKVPAIYGPSADDEGEPH